MNFAPTETQRILANSVERLLADKYDFRTRLRGLRENSQESLWPAFAELGLLGIEVDAGYGGSAGTFQDLAMALEPMGAALVVEPYIPCAVVATGLLNSLGTAAQKAAWLPRLVDGTVKACFAHSERRARDSTAWVECTATPVPAGWRIDGSKVLALGGHRADLWLISARTAGGPADTAGLSLFLVPAGHGGLGVESYTLYDGSGAADLTLSAVTVPDQSLLGTVDDALQWIALAQDRGAAAVCVESIGAMSAVYELTLAYLKTRKQFGRPLGQFQVLQHRMADVYMAVELARSMAPYAVAAIAEAEPRTRAQKISAAKVTIGRACREVGQSCIQLHGAIGLTEEYPAGHYFKRLTLLQRLFGDTEYHLRRYANASGTVPAGPPL